MSVYKINTLLYQILEQQLTQAECSWLVQKSEAPALELMTAFVAAPRFISKQIIQPDPQQCIALSEECPGFSVEGWNLVRTSRVWLLTCLNPQSKIDYIRHIETLFDTAEMNELVALYSALPLLSYPENWLFRATDAVRSNVGDVFDALVSHNPYPAWHFNELAWNQLVLKTIFNDKPIHYIVGLAERQNETLATILSDFAHERWAAGRRVAPQVWRLVPAFMNETLVQDMVHLFNSSDLHDQQAAALACAQSDFPEAQALLARHPAYQHAIEHHKLSWAQLEFKDLNTYVSE